MDGVLGRVDTSYIQTPVSQIYSHGNYPVKRLSEGQTIRFRSKNYRNEAIMKIEKLLWFDKMVIVSGSGISVAFDLNERVELVTIKEAEQDGR